MGNKALKLSISLIIMFLTNVIFSQSYYPYFFNEKWGIVDSNGDVTLSPSFEQIDIFKNNKFNDFTIFKSKNKTGVISGKGEIVVPLTSHQINYDHNGSFAWYYDNSIDEVGLHLFSLKNSKKLGFYEKLKVELIIGRETAFAILSNPKINKNVLLDINGKIIHEFVSNHILRVEFNELECPLIYEVNPPTKIISTFQCDGQTTSRKEFIIKNKIQENNEEEFYFGDINFENNLPKTESQLANLFPGYTHSESCTNYFSSLIESIILVKDKFYGLGSIHGKILLPCNFNNLSCEKGYILGQKANKIGLFTNHGKTIFDLNFKEISVLDLIEFNLIQLETFDGNKYFGSSSGKIYCPKGSTLK